MGTRFSNDGYLRFARIVPGSTVRFAAATDGTTLQLDGSQYTNNEGPCLDAARKGMIVRVEDYLIDGDVPTADKDCGS